VSSKRIWCENELIERRIMSWRRTCDNCHTDSYAMLNMSSFSPVASHEAVWLLLIITCVIILFLLSSHILAYSNWIMATYTESAMMRAIRVLGKCYSAPSAQPINGWSAFTSEFVGQLDHQFSRRLIIKYSHQADFLTLKNRLNNSERTEQSLTLAQSWWDEFSVYTQSHVFIR